MVTDERKLRPGRYVCLVVSAQHVFSVLFTSVALWSLSRGVHKTDNFLQMTKNLPTPLPAHVFVGSDACASLEAIRRPEINLVLVPRQEDSKVSRFIEENIEKGDFPTLKVKGTGEDICQLLEDKFANWKEKDGCDELVRDLKQNILAMQKLNKGVHLAVTLLKAQSQTCPKWHRDFYIMRWICSYHGPGTDWTTNDNVARENLRGGNTGVLLDESKVYSINPFWCGLMKGEVNNEGNGLVHKSPTVNEGVWRLLMKVDLLEDE